MASEILNYSKLPDKTGRRRINIRVLSTLVLCFAILTLLNGAYIEYVNYRTGSMLPLAPLAPGEHDTWRVAATSEHMYRSLKLRPTGDPVWETRPFTPAELADFRAWKKQGDDWNDLGGAVSMSCLLLPVVPLVFLGALFCFFCELSRGWRIALACMGVSQFAVAAMFVRLSLFDALSRCMP